MPRHSRCLLNKALHTAVVPEVWIDQSWFRRWENLYCPDINFCPKERHWGPAALVDGDSIEYLRKGIYHYKNHNRLWKATNRKHFMSPTFQFGAESSWNWVTRVRHPLVARRVWPCRITVLSFWTKHAAACLIKPSIRRCQRNLSIVFIFITYKEKDSYHVTPVGQLTFACCSYCGHSHRMQGGYNWLL